MNSLPRDVLHYMCQFCDPIDLVRLSQTTKRLKSIPLDDSLWLDFASRPREITLPPFRVFQHTQCLKDENVWKSLYDRRPSFENENHRKWARPPLELYPWRWLWHVSSIQVDGKSGVDRRVGNDGALMGVFDKNGRVYYDTWYFCSVAASLTMLTEVDVNGGRIPHHLQGYGITKTLSRIMYQDKIVVWQSLSNYTHFTITYTIQGAILRYELQQTDGYIDLYIPSMIDV